MSNVYSGKHRTTLLKMCLEKDISVPDSATRKEIVAILMKHDKKKKINTSKKTIKVELTECSDDELDEKHETIELTESDEHVTSVPENTTSQNTNSQNEMNVEKSTFKSQLIIGVGTSNMDADCTGITNDETVKWEDIVLGFAKCKYSNICIFEKGYDCFFTQDGKIDERIFAKLDNILVNNGSINIKVVVRDNKNIEKCNLISSRLDELYGVSNRNICGTFIIYRKNNGFRLGLNISELLDTTKPTQPQTSQPSSVVPEDFPPEVIKIKPQGKYTRTSSVLLTEVDDTIESTTGMTESDFMKEIEKPSFLESMKKSILDLFRYKKTFYQKKYVETKKEFEETNNKVIQLIKNGVDRKDAKDMHPMHVHYASFMIELESMVRLIDEYTSKVNVENIKSNLLDIFTNLEFGFPSIIGRCDVKERILSTIYAFSKSYKFITKMFNNMSIMGHAGCGKTSLAKMIAYAYSKSGIFATSRVSIATRAEMVGRYIFAIPGRIFR